MTEMLFAKLGQKRLGIGLPGGCDVFLLPDYVYICTGRVPVWKEYSEFLVSF